MYRVLVVLPFSGGSLSIGKYCATALQGIGCLVDVFETPFFDMPMEAFFNQRVSSTQREELCNSYIQLVSTAIIAQAERFKANLILALAQAPLTVNTLELLQKKKILTAMWFVEDYQTLTYWQTLAPYYDFFFTIQKEPFLTQLKEIGVKHPDYLPLAALPSVHKPIELTIIEQKQYSADVSFMGYNYPNRQKAFESLNYKNLKIWGTGWENASHLAQAIQKNEYVGPDEIVRIYNAGTINLNLHSSLDKNAFVSEGDFVNPRTFEIAACGGFQLVDQRNLLSDFFDDTEMITFTSLEELKQKINYFLEHPEERQVIADRAHQRVLNEHTYQHRMQQLIETVQTKYPYHPSIENQAWPAGLSVHLKESLSSLFEELKLQPHAGFSDLVDAIKCKSVPLSELEIAILFFDAWKKHYLIS